MFFWLGMLEFGDLNIFKALLRGDGHREDLPSSWQFVPRGLSLARASNISRENYKLYSHGLKVQMGDLRPFSQNDPSRSTSVILIHILKLELIQRYIGIKGIFEIMNQKESY